MERWPGMYGTCVSPANKRPNRQVPAALLLMLFVYTDKEEKVKAHTTRSSVSWAFAAVIEALPQGRKHPDCVDPQPLFL